MRGRTPTILVLLLLLLALSPLCARGDDVAGAEEGQSGPIVTSPPESIRTTAGVNIGFARVSMAISPSQHVLRNITGQFCAGRLTAVIGPSGSGKSSLLRALTREAESDSDEPVQGSIFLNGLEETAEHSFATSVVLRQFGFVQQDDTLFPHLTVRETIEYAARLRLGDQHGNTSISELVKGTMTLLGLSRQTQDSLVGDVEERGLSRGQRKRVSIGVELVAQTRICFLDKPTSGLDSTSAYELILALKTVADRGATIVTVLHQSRIEIWNLFDDVLVLAKGGRTVYMGPRQEVDSYLKSLGDAHPQFGAKLRQLSAQSNPADVLLDLTNSDGDLMAREWAQRKPTSASHFAHRPCLGLSEDELMLQRAGAGSSPLPPLPTLQQRRAFLQTAPAGASFLSQVWTQTSRSVLLMYRGYSLTCAFAAVALVLAVGSLNPNTPTPQIMLPHLLLVLGLGCIYVLDGLLMYLNEMPNIVRESRSGGSLFAYWIGKNLAGSIPLAILPLICTYLYRRQCNMRGNPREYWSIFFTMHWCCQSMGMLISLLFAPTMAIYVTVGVVLVLSLLSGFAPELTEIYNKSPIHSLIPSLSFARWSLEALADTELSGRSRLDKSSKRRQKEEAIRRRFSYLNKDNVNGTNAFMLVTLSLIFRLASWLALSHLLSHSWLTTMFGTIPAWTVTGLLFHLIHKHLALSDDVRHETKWLIAALPKEQRNPLRATTARPVPAPATVNPPAAAPRLRTRTQVLAPPPPRAPFSSSSSSSSSLPPTPTPTTPTTTAPITRTPTSTPPRWDAMLQNISPALDQLERSTRSPSVQPDRITGLKCTRGSGCTFRKDLPNMTFGEQLALRTGSMPESLSRADGGCHAHWDEYDYDTRRWACCNRKKTAPGCMTYPHHVLFNVYYRAVIA